MGKKYKNNIVVKESSYFLHIYGLRHDCLFLIDKEDIANIQSFRWGVMEVGPSSNKQLIPYTRIEGISVSLGRWLLNVADKQRRVEHLNRNPMDYRRMNLFARRIGYSQVKVSKNHNQLCGIYEVKNKKGELLGYRADLVKNKAIISKYFSVKKIGDSNLARVQAEAWKVHQVEKII